MTRPSPLQAIRLKCLDCCAGQRLEIKACSALLCPLWRFRLGIHPNTKKNLLNPLLEPTYWEGTESMSSSEALQLVERRAHP